MRTLRTQASFAIIAGTLFLYWSGGCSHRRAKVPTEPDHAQTSGEVTFDIESELGTQTDWTREYLRAVCAALVRLMDNPEVAPPQHIKVVFKRDPSLHGIGGFASEDTVGFISDEWPVDPSRQWIMAHELVNLFAHHYGGAGGYPSDWWSNGRSPFPEYASCIVMREAGYPEEAIWRKVQSKGKPDHDLYWKLDQRYGFALFSRFFKLLRHDGVKIGELGALPWPAPDKTRSLYTMAYLSLAGGTNLAPDIRAAGVGKEPPDWKQRHPEISFAEYDVGDDEVARLMQRRERLFGKNADRPELEAERARFRKGEP